MKNFCKENSIRSLQQCNTFTNLHQTIQFFLYYFLFLVNSLCPWFHGKLRNYFRIKLARRCCCRNSYILAVSLVIVFPFSLVLCGWSHLGYSSCFNCAESSDMSFPLTSTPNWLWLSLGIFCIPIIFWFLHSLATSHCSASYYYFKR